MHPYFAIIYASSRYILDMLKKLIKQNTNSAYITSVRSGKWYHLSPVELSSLSRKRSRKSTHMREITLPMPLLVLPPSRTFRTSTRRSVKRLVVARKYHVWCSSSMRLLDTRLIRCRSKHATEKPASSVYASVRERWVGLRLQYSSLLNMSITPGATKEIPMPAIRRHRNPTQVTLALRLVCNSVRLWNAIRRFNTWEVTFSLLADIWEHVGWGIGTSGEQIRTNPSISVKRVFNLITERKGGG